MRIDTAEWRPRDIEDLEATAWAALRAGSASVTAGPGAGKSEFLAQRAAYLLETGICPAPRQILAISFKRDAAGNLQHRVRQRLPEHADRFTAVTFDRFTKSLLDRFTTLLPPGWRMGDSYKVGFSSRDEIAGFLSDIARHAPGEFRDEVYRFSASSFVNNVVGATPLPDGPADPADARSARDYAVAHWWARNYVGQADPSLDFVMINRLAELIVRASPQLQAALRATYPFVFVDEFQDTTFAQYSFLRSVFAESGSVITVVGDRKQRIMGWAGALSDAFAEFERDFAAEPFVLHANFRSTQHLVDLQHKFAARLDPTSRPQASQVPSTLGATAVQIWSFASAVREADAIASWVAADMENSDRQPSDYGLIARQRVAYLEPALAAAFEKRGLRVRNDDALIGKIRLQDLLRDDLVGLLVGLIRLAAKRGGQPRTWLEVTDTLGRMASDVTGRAIGSQIEDDLTEFLTELRTLFNERELGVASDGADSGGLAASGPSPLVVASELTAILTRFANPENLARRRVLAHKPDEIPNILDAFRLRLTQVLERVSRWEQVADSFNDEAAVPLLTVHRSKGLEYHTVFFIGLDRDQWWAHARDTVESTMTFFVGVSRAAERLFFTQCDERGGRAPLGVIYEDMRDAGVAVVRFD